MSNLYKSEDFLENLISSGADAQSNLFEAEFTVDSTSEKESNLSGSFLENYSVRLQSVSIPSLEISTLDFPYLNTSIKKELPSQSLDRKLTLKFRLEENLNLYKNLLNCLQVGYSGSLKEKGLTWTICIRSLYAGFDTSTTQSSPYLGDDYMDYLDSIGEKNTVESTTSSFSSLKYSCIWTFKNCKLVSLSSLGFDYSNSSPLTIECSFIYETLS